MNHNLAMALLELEKAAGRVGQLMEGITPEEADRIAEVFGPAPKTFRLARWRAFWLQWCRDSAELLPCANPAGAAETRANEPIGPASWPQSFSDDVVQSAVSDAQNPDSFVPETQIRP